MISVQRPRPKTHHEFFEHGQGKAKDQDRVYELVRTAVGGPGHCISQTIGTTWGFLQARLLLKLSTAAFCACCSLSIDWTGARRDAPGRMEDVSSSSRLRSVMLCYQWRLCHALCLAMPCH